MERWFQVLHLPLSAWPKSQYTLKISAIGPPGAASQTHLQNIQSLGAPRLVLFNTCYFDQLLAKDIGKAVSTHHIAPSHVLPMVCDPSFSILLLQPHAHNGNNIVINRFSPVLIGRSHYPLMYDLPWFYPESENIVPDTICCAFYHHIFQVVWISVVSSCCGVRIFNILRLEIGVLLATDSLASFPLVVLSSYM